MIALKLLKIHYWALGAQRPKDDNQGETPTSIFRNICVMSVSMLFYSVCDWTSVPMNMFFSPQILCWCDTDLGSWALTCLWHRLWYRSTLRKPWFRTRWQIMSMRLHTCRKTTENRHSEQKAFTRCMCIPWSIHFTYFFGSETIWEVLNNSVNYWAPKKYLRIS